MKTLRIIILATVISAVLFSGCNKQLDALSPHNVNFTDQQFSSPAGYSKATIANYTTLVGRDYETSWFNFSEYRGNNVKVVSDPADGSSQQAIINYDAYKYINSDSKDFGLSNTFWFASYKALLGVNLVLANVRDDETNPVILQAKAENLFLRAFINFNLIRVYGRPYYQSPESNAGIPLVLKPLDVSQPPQGRGTVKGTYDQVVTDLKSAIASFQSKGANSFASKYAAYALLSRVYLYMSGTFGQPNADNARLAAQAADSVILKGGYTLLTGSSFTSMYNQDNTTNTEMIWAISHTVTKMNLPTLLLGPKGSYVGNYDTGQMKPSPDLLAQFTAGDLRLNFFNTDPYPGNTTDLLSTSKFSYKYLVGANAVYTSNAPFPHLRLAECYLNRAEGKIKAGDNTGALADLNVIHQRAGLPAYSGLTGQALFDAILKERRIELNFEGHNGYDYYRNGLPMVRNFGSFNFPALTVQPTDPRVVMRLSLDALAENGTLTQNAQ